MAVIRLTKEFKFEAAHALKGYDGPCKSIHGHSYGLFVTVSGEPICDPASPKDGMIIDFSALKSIVRDCIIEPFDHSLIIQAGYPEAEMSRAGEMFSKLVVVPYQPTSENLLIDFASRISAKLPEGVHLCALKLQETVTSAAEWLASDQPNNERT
ncbi:MAG: 6-carboxytetrahydropterin synthase [Bacteroidetes bacterium]|nr:6-carboxytetrahydropterin synthase [Bacteroidota bacterium]